MAHAIALRTARLWRQYPQHAVAMMALAVAAFAALAGAAYSSPTLSDLTDRNAQASAKAPPAPPPLLVRELPVQDAMAINRGIPIAAGPNPPARPFSFAKADEAARSRALECLTSAVYYEAGSESSDGQRAVAQVVLNRVRHPAFPASVCGVVYEGSTRPTGCQFTFTCDGSLSRTPVPSLWERARKVATAALNGQVYKPAGNATHYHADYVVPYWAATLTKNAVVGAHIFYRWSGGWGRPAAFSQAYARREPDSRALRFAALQVERTEEPEAVIAEVPGAEPLPITEKVEGRIGVRFTLAAREAARKAVEEAPKVEYVERVDASDNLRWALSGNLADEGQAPLGKPKATAPAGVSTATGAPN